MIGRVLLWAIAQYQQAFEGRPSPCRFFPSCSEYAREAVEVHGSGRGSLLAVRRLARCRPFGPSGFDPVPLPSGSPATTTDHHCGNTAAHRHADAAGPSPLKVS